MRYILGGGFTYNTEGRCELHQHPGHTVPVIEWREIGDTESQPCSYCRFCSLNIARTAWPLKGYEVVIQKWNTAVSVAASAKTKEALAAELSTQLRSRLIEGLV